MEANPSRIYVRTVWRIICILITDVLLSAASVCLKRTYKGVNIPQADFTETVFKKFLITTCGFDWDKKDFCTENMYSRHSTAGKSDNHLASQWHNICLYSISMELQNSFNYSALTVQSGMTLMNQKLIHEETKSRLKSGNASYHSMQSLLSSS
jgi:hypothetical protein